MRQLFSNVIQNSLKYASPERNPVIKITASQEPVIIKDLFHVYCHWIRFSDNGIGFDQEYADKIFILFNRLHNKNEYSGTGLGLAISKKLTEIMNV